jgi:hypothetical protein
MTKNAIWVAVPLVVIGTFLVGCNTNAPVQSASGATDDSSSSSAPQIPEPKKPILARLFNETREVSLPAGTAVRVRLVEAVDTDNDHSGDVFTATLDSPLVIGKDVVVPRGARFQGRVTSSDPSGRLKGRAYLALTLDSFDLNGQKYVLRTNTVERVSDPHKKRNWMLIGGGSGVGAAIGAIAGGGKGAAIGAAAGAGAGTAGAAATGKMQVRLPAETPLTFSLSKPVPVKLKS